MLVAEKTVIPIPHLSGMENDQRPIGKATAKKLAAGYCPGDTSL